MQLRSQSVTSDIDPDDALSNDGVLEDELEVPESEEMVFGDEIRGDLSQNVKHHAIKVAHHSDPFVTEEESARFLHSLTVLNTEHYTPAGYALMADEWDGGDYPEAEEIRVGIHTKPMSIPLPLEVWFPRALRWGRALDLLSRILHDVEGQGSASDTSQSDDD